MQMQQRLPLMSASRRQHLWAACRGGGLISAYSAYSAVALSAIAVSAPLCHDALKLDLGVMAKVDQQPQFEPRRFEIVLHLRPMFVSQLAHRLEFQNDLFMTDEVRLVLGPKRTAFVFQGQGLLRDE